ncbi:unnamed protein product [Acanthocheilonema viteae]|uniref:STI1 domain-containing protein n=1 Tax=Acanthocheilonema viteae TaxID=6277 RepID=A0A498S1P9_ACAVI|nr:unnamed protein product [Acanthocheilonema viteae]
MKIESSILKTAAIFTSSISKSHPVFREAKKILEHNRNKERRREERELKSRQERIRQAQEARKREEEEKKHADCAGGSFGSFGMPNMPKGFEKIFQDSEVMSLLQDEGVLAAYMDIINNPANIAKHMSNPKVMKLFSKIGNATGGFSMGGGNPEMKETAANGGTTTNTTPSNKAPEPDLD